MKRLYRYLRLLLGGVCFFFTFLAQRSEDGLSAVLASILFFWFGVVVMIPSAYRKRVVPETAQRALLWLRSVRGKTVTEAEDSKQLAWYTCRFCGNEATFRIYTDEIDPNKPLPPNVNREIDVCRKCHPELGSDTRTTPHFITLRNQNVGIATIRYLRPKKERDRRQSTGLTP